VQFIAPGDFDNDGLPDLCVLTAKGATLYRNTGTRFVKQADLATGNFRKAVWIDYDHDYDEDLILIGDDSRLMRNNGEAGFSDETKRFPFVAGGPWMPCRSTWNRIRPASTWWCPMPTAPACSIATGWAERTRPCHCRSCRRVRASWSPPTSNTTALPIWISNPAADC